MTPSISERTSSDRKREFAWTAALGAAFFAIAFLSLTFTKEAGSVAAVWPANALLLVALLKAPRGGRGTRIAAAWLGNVAAAMATGNHLALFVFLASMNTIEVLVCFLTIVRFAGKAVDLTQPR